MDCRILICVVTMCCYVQCDTFSENPEFVDAIMDIVGRIEKVTNMTVDMANTIKSFGYYSNEKWGFDFFKIQLKTAAIYRKVIEHSRRNAEISKIKDAAKDFQKSSVTNVEIRMVDKLKKLMDSSIKTKVLAEKLYELMEPYKSHKYPDDYENLKAIRKKLDLTVENVYYVLDTTFDILNYVDKKEWCSYLKRMSPKKSYGFLLHRHQ